MGDIREIRPGASQELGFNPPGEKATVRITSMDRTTAAYCFVMGFRPEMFKVARGLTYGPFGNPEYVHALDNDESFAAHFVDYRNRSLEPFTQAVEDHLKSREEKAEPLDEETRQRLFDILPKPKEESENLVKFEPDPVVREAMRLMIATQRKAIEEMNKALEEYEKDIEAIIQQTE